MEDFTKPALILTNRFDQEKSSNGTTTSIRTTLLVAPLIAGTDAQCYTQMAKKVGGQDLKGDTEEMTTILRQ